MFVEHEFKTPSGQRITQLRSNQKQIFKAVFHENNPHRKVLIKVGTSFGKTVLLGSMAHYELVESGMANKIFVLVMNSCLEKEQKEHYCPLAKQPKDYRFTVQPGIYYVQYEDFFAGLKMLKDEYSGRVSEFRNILVLIDEADLFAKELDLDFRNEAKRLTLFDPIAVLKEMRLVMVSGTFSGQTGIEELKSAFGVEVLATQENVQTSSYDECEIHDVRHKKLEVKRVHNIKKDRVIMIHLSVEFAIEKSQTQPVIVMFLNEHECNEATKRLIEIIGQEEYEKRGLNFSWEQNQFSMKCRKKNNFVEIDVKPIVFTTLKFSYGHDFVNYNLERNLVIISFMPQTESQIIQMGGRSNRFDPTALPQVIVMHGEGDDRLTFPGLIDQLQLNEWDQDKLLPTNYPDLIARLKVYIAGLNATINDYGGTKNFSKWRKALDEVIDLANEREKWEDVMKPLQRVQSIDPHQAETNFQRDPDSRQPVSIKERRQQVEAQQQIQQSSPPPRIVQQLQIISDSQRRENEQVQRQKVETDQRIEVGDVNPQAAEQIIDEPMSQVISNAPGNSLPVPPNYSQNENDQVNDDSDEDESADSEAGQSNDEVTNNSVQIDENVPGCESLTMNNLDTAIQTDAHLMIGQVQNHCNQYTEEVENLGGSKEIIKTLFLTRDRIETQILDNVKDNFQEMRTKLLRTDRQEKRLAEKLIEQISDSQIHAATNMIKNVQKVKKATNEHHVKELFIDPQNESQERLNLVKLSQEQREVNDDKDEEPQHIDVGNLVSKRKYYEEPKTNVNHHQVPQVQDQSQNNMRKRRQADDNQPIGGRPPNRGSLANPRTSNRSAVGRNPARQTQMSRYLNRPQQPSDEPPKRPRGPRILPKSMIPSEVPVYQSSASKAPKDETESDDSDPRQKK